MIIDAKTGTINAILMGAEKGQGGVCFPFKYPERADILDMDKDQIFKAICDAGVGISDIKDMVHDIELTFTADPICIDREAKEMTIDEVHKSFKDALEEIAEQNKVIDLAVDEVSRMTGGMTTLIAKDKDLDFDEKVATHKKNIKQGLFARCKGDD